MRTDGVPAHTATFVHAGAWFVPNVFPVAHTEDTYIDLRGAKYHSDPCVPKLPTYHHTYCAINSSRRDVPHSDAYGYFYVSTDTLVAHIEGTYDNCAVPSTS